MLKKDAFGKPVFAKRLVTSLVGVVTYPRFKWLTRVSIEGMEVLHKLPKKNVLFVCNHQTYFADVMAIMHMFSSAKWKRKNKLGNPFYLLSPVTNTYFVAANETMKAGILPKILGYVGSINVKRTFREAGQDIKRQVEMKDVKKIGMALESGWVITFPQGTTTPFAPGRRGTVLVVKKFDPIVVPIVIDGFRKTFDKKGFKIKKRGGKLSLRVKEPLIFQQDEDPNVMLETIMDAIEQSKKFQRKESGQVS
jgi:1-acyl-sn-glycerol-3-phosphate acyltransferase